MPIEQDAVDGAAVPAVPAVETPITDAAAVEAPAPTVEVDEDDKVFAEYAAKANARKAERNGTAPAAAADVVVAPKVDAATPAPKAPAALDVKDEELIAALPEDRREAARARFAAAATSEAERKRLDHANRSMAGRVSAFQLKYEQARGLKPAEVEKAATEEETAEWKQFAEDYPDVAKGMEARLKSLRPGTDPSMQEMVTYVQEQKRERFLTEAWDAVESVHPGWREKGKTPEFQEWLKSSPTHGKLAASDELSDAIALFDLWDGHTLKNAPKPEVVDPSIAANAAKLAAKRDAQLEGGRAAPAASASPNANVDPNDEDQMFNAYAKAANARMKARNA